MKVRSVILLACTGFGVLTSCQKEVDTQLRTQSDDTVFLSKFVRLDTTYLPGNDTTYIAEIQYDAQKRTSEIKEFFFTSGTSIVDFFRRTTIHYTGNDTLPYRFCSALTAVTNPQFSLIDTNYLFYNNGQVVKDSLIEWQNNAPGGKLRKTYSEVIPGLYNVRLEIADFNTGVIMSSDSIRCKREWTGNNITLSLDTLFYRGAVAEKNITRATYDNMRNPFRRFRLPFLANPRPQQIQYSNTLIDFSELEGNNNPVYIERSGATFNVPGFDTMYNVAITYNDYGYPAEKKYVLLSSGIYKRKELFTYIIL